MSWRPGAPGTPARNASVTMRIAGTAAVPVSQITSGTCLHVRPGKGSNRMNVALWIVAGLLAAVLLGSSAKTFVPKEKMAGMLGEGSRWVEDFSPGALKAIGVLEFLGAVGLILPAALDIAPVL